MSAQVVFEHPLNERVRTFLRLEHLFERVSHFASQEDAWSTRAAVETLIDVVAITSRADIRSELVKELDRNVSSLQRVRHQPGVDLDKLDGLLVDLQQTAAGIQALGGQVGQAIRDDLLLKAVAQRMSIPGGTCSFDIPQYHYWLTQALSERRSQLDEWLGSLRSVQTAIERVLGLARRSGTPEWVETSDGFYQETLDINAPAQLVRIGLSDDAALYPEISGHKNRFSIRFMRFVELGRTTAHREAVRFELTRCVF